MVGKFSSGGSMPGIGPPLARKVKKKRTTVQVEKRRMLDICC